MGEKRDLPWRAPKCVALQHSKFPESQQLLDENPTLEVIPEGPKKVFSTPEW